MTRMRPKKALLARTFANNLSPLILSLCIASKYTIDFITTHHVALTFVVHVVTLRMRQPHCLAQSILGFDDVRDPAWAPWSWDYCKDQ